MYAKLFASLYQGTMRGQSDLLLVFTALLAHADKEGHVDIHPRAIAEAVGISVDRVRLALDALESPDPESRSPAEDGRRIIRIDEHRSWGWTITNYAKYHSIRNEEERREQNRQAQARWRQKAADKQSKPASANVSQHKPMSAHIDVDVDVDKEVSVAKATSQQPSGPSGPRCAVDERFERFWSAYPKKVGKDAAKRAFDKRRPDDTLARLMVDSVNAQKSSAQWLKDGGQYIPNPATWINQGRWQDDAGPQGLSPLFHHPIPAIAKGAAIEAHNNAVAQRILERMEREQRGSHDTE
jgi:hypothetical protein